MKVRYPGEGLASGLQNNGLLRVPWAGLKQNNLLDFFFWLAIFLLSPYFLAVGSCKILGERGSGAPRGFSASLTSGMREGGLEIITSAALLYTHWGW